MTLPFPVQIQHVGWGHHAWATVSLLRPTRGPQRFWGTAPPALAHLGIWKIFWTFSLGIRGPTMRQTMRKKLKMFQPSCGQRSRGLRLHLWTPNEGPSPHVPPPGTSTGERGLQGVHVPHGSARGGTTGLVAGDGPPAEHRWPAGTAAPTPNVPAPGVGTPEEVLVLPGGTPEEVSVLARRGTGGDRKSVV